MGILDDTAIFATVIQHGSFSAAAKYLGLSNGLISRRIAQLESRLGVTLIKRTTRQLSLTSEGDLLWQHAKRIHQELDSAVSLIQSLTDKPTGLIRVSASLYFGRHHLMPVIHKFLSNFSDIKIELLLSNQLLDPIKENLDLIIRGVGYINKSDAMKDSSLKIKPLLKQKINLFASPAYLAKYGEPQSVEELTTHRMIGYASKTSLQEEEAWVYSFKGKQHTITIRPGFTCNDIDSSVSACVAGYGIGRFSDLVLTQTPDKQQLRRILTQYDWGDFQLFAAYSSQQPLPKRTRLFLECVTCYTKHLSEMPVQEFVTAP